MLASILILFKKTLIMIQENLYGSIDPDDTLKVKKVDEDNDAVQDEPEDEGDYDILPSNGPGLTGDDGDQVIDYEEDEDDDK
ncbi:hypothetical protein BH11BAC4_BH11BAC4_17350 [soil metagenome]